MALTSPHYDENQSSNLPPYISFVSFIYTSSFPWKSLLQIFLLLSKFSEPRVLIEKPAETFFRKPFMTAIFYKAVIKLVDPISKVLDYLLNSDEAEAFSFFEAFHTVIVFLFLLLVALIALPFQPFRISPLETHFAIFLVFIVATIIYGIAYVLIKLQSPDTEYCPIFRFICLVFGIIAIELLVSTIISPFWLFIINLCPILIVGVLCSYKQIYQLLCYTAILVFNAVPSLFEKIYQLVHQIYDWLRQIFQLAIFQAFSSREREDNDNQGLEMV